MARLEHLELPDNTPGLLPQTIEALNDRFLRIASQLKQATATSAGVLQATHLERTSQAQYAAEKQTVGTQFWESDRTSVYLVRAIAKAKVWQFEAGLYADAYAKRPSDLALYDAGFLFYATDRTVLWRWSGSAWVYYWGTMRATQSQLAAIAAALGTNDVGFLVWVTDYAHMLCWSGTNWQRGPGDPEHSDTFVGFGFPPTDAGWHACDGSSVNFLKYDGSLGTRTLPNLAGSAGYMKLGNSYASAITAAVVPTLAMNPYTPAGTLAMNSFTPAGTNSAPVFTGSPLATHTHDAPLGEDGSHNLYRLAVNGVGGSYTASSKATGVADSSTLAASQTSANSAGTPAGTVSAPTFTGTPATPTGTFTGTPATLTGTISLPGDPIANFEAIAYYRQ